MEKVKKSDNGLNLENFILMALPIKGKQEMVHVYKYNLDLSKDNKVFNQEINKFRKELDELPDFKIKGHLYLIIPSGIKITIVDETRLQISLEDSMDKDLRKRMLKVLKQLSEQLK